MSDGPRSFLWRATGASQARDTRGRLSPVRSIHLFCLPTSIAARCGP